MKKPIVHFLLAIGVVLSTLSMSASALDYGVLRPRSTVDSTGTPSLVGTPPRSDSGSTLLSSPPGSHCGWVVIHNDGNFSPSLPCNGQMIPMGNVYQCAAGQVQSGIPGSPCYSEEWVETCGEGCSWSAIITYHPAIGSTIDAVGNERAVSFYNCPAAYAFTFLNAPDGKREYTCIKS